MWRKGRRKTRKLLNPLFWGALQRTRWLLVMRHLQLKHCSSHCAQVCLQGTFSPLLWISPLESQRTSLFSLQPMDLSCLSKFSAVSKLNIFLFFSHPRWDKVSVLESAKVRGDSLTGCRLDFSYVVSGGWTPQDMERQEWAEILFVFPFSYYSRQCSVIFSSSSHCFQRLAKGVMIWRKGSCGPLSWHCSFTHSGDLLPTATSVDTTRKLFQSSGGGSPSISSPGRNVLWQFPFLPPCFSST